MPFCRKMLGISARAALFYFSDAVRLVRDTRFQKTVMVLLTIMIVWTAIEKIFDLGSWSRFSK